MDEPARMSHLHAVGQQPADGCTSRTEQLRILREAVESLCDIESGYEGLQRILDAAIRAAEMDCGWIYLFDEARSTFEAFSAQGLSADFAGAVSDFAADRCNATVVLTGEPFYGRYGDLHPSPTEPETLEGLGAIAVVPIRYRKRVIGGLNVASRARDRIADDARLALEIMATQIGAAITGRKAQEGLKRKITELNSFVNNIPDMAWLKDRNSNFIAANQAFGKAVGMEPQYLIDHTCEICFGKEAAEKFKADDRRVMESGKQTVIEESVTDARGETIFLETIKSPILDESGEVAGTVGIARDVTARKRTYAALRETESRFRALFDNALTIIYVHDFEGRFLDANDSALSLFGYRRDEIASLSFTDILEPSDLERAFELGRKLRVRGVDTETHEFRLRTKDGRHVWLEVTGSRLDKDDKPYAILGIGRDITEQRKMHATLAQTDRMASVGVLAAGVAHEINNPLTYVLYHLEGLLDEIPRLTRSVRKSRAALSQHLGQDAAAAVLRGSDGTSEMESFDETIERIREAAEGATRIKRIVRDLKTFARMDEERLVATKLEEVMESAASMAFNEIKFRARLVKDYGETPPVLANEGRLAQVFLNLLINAAHSIEEGNADGNLIQVRTWTEGGMALAEVKDTGGGIRQEHLNYLFDPFFTTKKAGIGSGLGLSISHNIISSLGGKIEVESQLGNGSRFVVRLPIAENAEDKPAGPALSKAETARARGRILVVDDEPQIGSAVKHALRGAHDVVVVTSGLEAKRVLEGDRSFDMILCDVMMPEVSGLDLYQWLREAYPELAERVVFITGGAFTPKTRQFLGQIENRSIEKPFDIRLLREIASEAVGFTEEKA